MVIKTMSIVTCLFAVAWSLHITTAAKSWHHSVTMTDGLQHVTTMPYNETQIENGERDTHFCRVPDELYQCDDSTDELFDQCLDVWECLTGNEEEQESWPVGSRDRCSIMPSQFHCCHMGFAYGMQILSDGECGGNNGHDENSKNNIDDDDYDHDDNDNNQEGDEYDRSVIDLDGGGRMTEAVDTEFDDPNAVVEKWCIVQADTWDLVGVIGTACRVPTAVAYRSLGHDAGPHGLPLILGAVLRRTTAAITFPRDLDCGPIRQGIIRGVPFATENVHVCWNEV